MYLMNYLIDFDQKSGLFTGDRHDFAPAGSSKELFMSKNWLKLVPTAAVPEPGAPFPAAFNTEAATWMDLGDMDSGSLLVPQSPSPDDSNIGIRVALDPGSDRKLSITLGQHAQDAILNLAVCFGRPSQGAQFRASPFEDTTPAKAVKTTYLFANHKANQVDGHGNAISWFFPLDMVKFRPPANRKNRTHRYEFSVGMTLTSGGVTRHYSHDPEMDVST